MPQFYLLAEGCWLVQFADEISPAANQACRALVVEVQRNSFPGFIEAVAAYASVAVYFDPLRIHPMAARDRLNHLCERLHDVEMPAPREIEIPVCYGGEFGPDLADVAAHCGLTAAEVVKLHAAAEYTVYFIGFIPGFAYLAGLPAALATPRRRTPRLSVPAGSVGIAGRQTGVYPLATPGGWQIIGRTPLSLFRTDRDPPALCQAGDKVRFVPVSREAYMRYA